MTSAVIKLSLISIILLPLFQMPYGMEEKEVQEVQKVQKVKNDLGDHQDDDIVLEGSYEVDALLKAVRDKSLVIERGVHMKRSFKKKEEKEKEEEGEENVLVRQVKDIRVMQWNVCSQVIGEYVDIFSKVPKEIFSWPHRRYHILTEIVTYMPDIITLQEVDHFKFLATTLKTQNYEGLFYPKPHSLAIWYPRNNGRDGLAVFYRADRFQLKRSKEVNLPDKIDGPPVGNQIISMVYFFDKKNQKEICVVTTHLKAARREKTNEVRLMQAQMLSDFVKEECDSGHTIITGDLNDAPSGEVYKLFSDRVPVLSSAYKVVLGDEPLYTTWKYRNDTGEKMQTLDYVFYTDAHFAANKVLCFPDKAAIGENLLPCLGYPSDHMSLVADLAVK